MCITAFSVMNMATLKITVRKREVAGKAKTRFMITDIKLNDNDSITIA